MNLFLSFLSSLLRPHWKQAAWPLWTSYLRDSCQQKWPAAHSSSAACDVVPFGVPGGGEREGSECLLQQKEMSGAGADWGSELGRVRWAHATLLLCVGPVAAPSGDKETWWGWLLGVPRKAGP